MPSMRIIGLTGGTGSGKSEVARRLAERGIPVLDADAIGHALIAPGGAAVEPVRARFGDAIFTCGTIDRKKLADLVFGDSEALAALNALVHPLIRAEILRRCTAYVAEGHGAVIVDAAILGEDGTRWEPLDGLILVLSPEGARIERLVASRGWSENDARRRIAAQIPQERKIPLADWVIDNSGTLDELRARADAIAKELGCHVT